jgi:hypothetical protein
VDGIAEAKVPDLVAELVARGAAIHAVVPTRHSLEERFMSLLATAPDVGDTAVPVAVPVAVPAAEAGDPNGAEAGGEPGDPNRADAAAGMGRP